VSLDFWIEKIPKNWRSKRLKYAAPLRTTRVEATSEDQNYLGLENIRSWTGQFVASNYTEITTDAESESAGASGSFQVGDILFGKLRPYLAKVFLADRDGHCTTELLVLQPNTELIGKYLMYSLLRSEFITNVDSSTFGARMPRANWDFIGNIQIPIPPLETQKRIADYLDSETTQIDALILEKERMLELLEEKRAALISQAVTKGLNPNAPMKESGLEWLGKIPEHWELRRVKYFAEVGNGSTPNRENLAYWQGGTFPWLNSSVVNERIITEIPRYVTEEALKECHLPQIKPPAVLVGITGQGKTRGKTAILNFEATINQHVAFIKPSLQFVNCYFLNYLMDTAYNFLRNESESAGSTKGAMTCEQIANFYVPLPKTSEQEKILEYIESELAQYIGIETDLQKSLKLLHERRSALITAAVTGQLETSEVKT
jgi:type I restriction enzyme, S subunit